MLTIACGSAAASGIMDAIGKIGPVLVAAIVALLGWMQYRNGKEAAARAYALQERERRLNDQQFALELLDQRRDVYNKIEGLLVVLYLDDQPSLPKLSEAMAATKTGGFLFAQPVRAKLIALHEALNAMPTGLNESPKEAFEPYLPRAKACLKDALETMAEAMRIVD